MRYFAVAADYDGTLARHGRVAAETIAALEALAGSGRQCLLVTGRRLDDLLAVFPHAELCATIVCENGAVLYHPATRETRLLAAAPDPALVAALEEAGVTPLQVGAVIVATEQPHEAAVLAAIQARGLEHQIIFNKGAVMVLPPGVNKATGLAAALEELGLSPHNVVGIGDAENDHALLDACEFGVAVANAVPALRDRADFVTRGEDGAGIVELVEQLIADDLKSWTPREGHKQIDLGSSGDAPVRLPAYGVTVLIAGPSGSGKSTVTAALLERLMGAGYQCCLVDPEGDYHDFADMVSVGDGAREPSIDVVLDMLSAPGPQIAVNLLGVPLGDRPAFLARLLPRLQEQRARTGRPHWIVLDEAHHVLREQAETGELLLPRRLYSLMLVTLYPDQLPRTVLDDVDIAIAVGQERGETLASFARTVDQTLPDTGATSDESDLLVWWRRESGPPRHVKLTPGRLERHRHQRKYMQGELLAEHRFHFRGREGKLDLVAENLRTFLRLAHGVDDETWLFHLQQGDYTAWFRTAIKDEELAAAAERIAHDAALDPRASRERIQQEIEARYSLPA